MGVKKTVAAIVSKLGPVAKAVKLIGSKIPLPKLAVIRSTGLKIGGLLRGGVWFWVGLAMFVVAENWAGAVASVQSVTPVPLLASLASNLASSYVDMIAGLRSLPGSSGVAYLGAVHQVVLGVAHIFWYFRGWYFVSRLVEGYNISKLYMYGFGAIPFYVTLVWAETGVVPVFSHVAELGNVSELLEFERVSPWHDPGVNESVNQSVNATVNGTGE